MNYIIMKDISAGKLDEGYMGPLLVYNLLCIYN